MKRASAIILGFFAAVALLFALRELLGYGLDAYFRSYMEEHADELKEQIRQKVRERECELACMEKKETE